MLFLPVFSAASIVVARAAKGVNHSISDKGEHLD